MVIVDEGVMNYDPERFHCVESFPRNQDIDQSFTERLKPILWGRTLVQVEYLHRNSLVDDLEALLRTKLAVTAPKGEQYACRERRGGEQSGQVVQRDLDVDIRHGSR